MQDRQHTAGPFRRPVGGAGPGGGGHSPGSRHGQPWLVTIEGDPGVGKTALARRVPGRGGRPRVLSARADPAEADLEFGIVEQLLRRRPEAGRGPGAWRAGAARAVVVRGRGPAAGGGGRAAGRGPVAIVIDDLQWADRRSVEALTFTLRRLSVDPVVADRHLPRARRSAGRGGPADAAERGEPAASCRWAGWRGGRGAAGGRAGRRGRWTRDASAVADRRPAGTRCTCARCWPTATASIRMRRAGRRCRASLAAAVGDQLRRAAAADPGHPGDAGGAEPRAAAGPAGPGGGGRPRPARRSSRPSRPAWSDWWPEEPTCPVVIRHPLVRDAIYAGIPASRRRELHARAAALVGEAASWEHRVAALDQPDEGLAAELERLAAAEAAAGRLALAATHLQWASDISPARADRERRLLTAALHLTLAEESRGLALRPAVEATAPSPLRGCVLGTMAFAAGQLARGRAAVQPGAGPGARRPGQPAAGRADRQPAGRHLHAAGRRGEGDGLRAVGAGAPGAWTRRPPARPAP